MITDPLAHLVVLAAVVFAALRLESSYRPFRALGAGLVGILLGMLLSNTGLLPGTSPTYQWLSSHGVSLAVAFILLRVDIGSVVSAGPRMLAAFAIGAAGTAVGAVTGALLFADAVGPESWKLAGQFTGTYTGGGMNFAALGRALDTSSDMFTAAVAADVSLTAIWMAACLTVPVLLGSKGDTGPVPSGDDVAATDTLERALISSIRPVAVVELAAVMAIAVAAVWLAGVIGAAVPVIPDVLWLTSIVLLAAQLPAVRRLPGSALMGNYLLLMFLAANGAQSVIANIFRVGPGVFWFALTTITVHGVVIFGIGRLAGIDAGTLAVASQANVGGPASAVALASARGYGDKLLPGVAVGLLGYAVGNYAGFVVATVVRGWIGG